MTSTALSPQLARPPAQFQFLPGGIDKYLLLQTLAISVPAWALMGSPLLGAYVYYALLIVFVGWHGLQKAPERITALLLATIPALVIFRNKFFYDGPQAMFALALLVWYEYRRPSVRELLRDKLVMGLITFSSIYWISSWLMTGDGHSNFRMFDLVTVSVSVILLYREVKIFRTAMLGLGLCVLCEAGAFLAFGGRLGYAELDDGGSVGNPTSLGIPLALLSLLSLVHGGRLIEVKNSPIFRYGLMFAAGAALLLSTSRGSWLVALAGLAVIFVFQREQRGTMLACALGMVAATALLLQTERGVVLNDYLDKTFNSELSIDKRTTGRAAQWKAFPAMIADSPVWGHGPGMGRHVAAEYAGRFLALHSLYLQIGAETGLLGLGFLAWFLVLVFQRGFDQANRFAEPVPLMAALGYLTMGVSVSGIDLNAGVFLGLAMLKPQGRLWRVRTAVLMPEGASGLEEAWPSGSGFPQVPGR